jgi:hypothetical protein
MSDTNEPQDDPKIIVDEDWKTQVEREKEELKKKEAEGGMDEELPELPPATFPVLLSTLATQAMASLGIFPDPVTGKHQSNRPLAKHFIDLIAMLEEKTKGNLTDDEAKQTQEALHQLRMAFVSVPDTPAEDSDEGPDKPTIELP